MKESLPFRKLPDLSGLCSPHCKGKYPLACCVVCIERVSIFNVLSARQLMSAWSELCVLISP